VYKADGAETVADSKTNTMMRRQSTRHVAVDPVCSRLKKSRSFSNTQTVQWYSNLQSPVPVVNACISIGFPSENEAETLNAYGQNALLKHGTMWLGASEKGHAAISRGILMSEITFE
jgi:hypothetical protein